MLSPSSSQSPINSGDIPSHVGAEAGMPIRVLSQSPINSGDIPRWLKCPNRQVCVCAPSQSPINSGDIPRSLNHMRQAWESTSSLNPLLIAGTFRALGVERYRLPGTGLNPLLIAGTFRVGYTRDGQPIFGYARLNPLLIAGTFRASEEPGLSRVHDMVSQSPINSGDIPRLPKSISMP